MSSDISNGDRVEQRHAETYDVYKKIRRGEVAKRLGIGLACLLLAAVLGVQLVTVLLIRHQQVDNVSVAHSTAVTADQVKKILTELEDCLTPGGKCYTRSQSSQSQALETVAKIGVIIQTCHDRNPATVGNTPALWQCVQTQMKGLGLSDGH